MNSFGHIFRITTAGESHGPAMVVIIDGMPAGITVDLEHLHTCLQRRRTSYRPDVKNMRAETDEPRILSGVFEGITTGAPIAIMIENHDARSQDYDHLRHVFRPSHADFTYQAKYGIRDHRGGGRASARETVLRVAAGAFADMALRTMGVETFAFTRRIGSVATETTPDIDTLRHIYQDPMRCPDPVISKSMDILVKHVREAGDTVGGIVSGIITGLPVGVGEPIYDKFQAMLAQAMMSINAAHGFEYGMGFAGASRLGSEMNDPFTTSPEGHITTATNHSGGIQGGITTGRAVTFNVAFKPVATLMREYTAITDSGAPVTINPGGRHDSCVVPRAVAIVQAMASITALDALLLSRR